MKPFQEGDSIHLLQDNEAPHEYMVPVYVGDIAVHREFGDVQIQHTEERGWHYLRWGYGSFGVDFENVGLPRELCAARMAELHAQSVKHTS